MACTRDVKYSFIKAVDPPEKILNLSPPISITKGHFHGGRTHCRLWTRQTRLWVLHSHAINIDSHFLLASFGSDSPGTMSSRQVMGMAMTGQTARIRSSLIGDRKRTVRGNDIYVEVHHPLA